MNNSEKLAAIQNLVLAKIDPNYLPEKLSVDPKASVRQAACRGSFHGKQVVYHRVLNLLTADV